MPAIPKASVVVVGSSNTDLVLSCKRLPKPGETLLGGEFQRFHGGKGANQAVAAARAGARVSFVGARGRDDFGREALAALRHEHIDVRNFGIRAGASSGVALILLGGKSRENLIAVARSANDSLSSRDLAAAAGQIQSADIILAQLEIPLPAVVEAAKLARKFRVPFLLNPAPARRLPASLLRMVHTLTPNEHESSLLTGEEDPERAALLLLRSGCRQVIVTLGAKGALLAHNGKCHHFPAPKVKAVDTVGAGDCFSAWLAVGIAEGLPIEAAISRSLRAASLSVTRYGAQAGLPYRKEVPDGPSA